MPLTAEQVDVLRMVNELGNRIPYDDAIGKDEPPDWWTDQAMAGNSFVCRDYTQWKADRLKERGWPSDSLTVLLCYVETGEYHAVLAVQPAGSETLILDNRFDEPYLMSRPPAGYRWDRRQRAGTATFVPVA